MSEKYQTIEIETAPEFLFTLRRSNPMWLEDNNWECDWVFRGQADSTWGLHPSAWREQAKQNPLYRIVDRHTHQVDAEGEVKRSKEVYRQSKNNPTETALFLLKQKRFEFDVVSAFCNFVDELGFRVPGGKFQRTDRSRAKPFDDSLSFDDFHPAFALAQHHGVPTRLLDWTFDPLVAAFFASDSEDVGERIAVWAFHTHGYGESGFRQFQPERSGLGFLHAQHGIFTYHDHADDYYCRNGKWPAFEELVWEKSIKKITLPKSEVRQLRRLLWAERITRAHLMPTFDNISQCLQLAWERSAQMGKDRATVRE